MVLLCLTTLSSLLVGLGCAISTVASAMQCHYIAWHWHWQSQKSICCSSQSPMTLTKRQQEDSTIISRRGWTPLRILGWGTLVIAGWPPPQCGGVHYPTTLLCNSKLPGPRAKKGGAVQPIRSGLGRLLSPECPRYGRIEFAQGSAMACRRLRQWLPTRLSLG